MYFVVCELVNKAICKDHGILRIEWNNLFLANSFKIIIYKEFEMVAKMP